MKLISMGDFHIETIINDFNENKYDYEENPPHSIIEIETPIEIQLIKEYYYSKKRDEIKNEKLLNICFIWDFATSLILYVEKYRGSTVLNYWGEIDPLKNHLKTKLLINKACFAHEKDLLHTYKKPLANCYFSILSLSFFIAKAYDNYELSSESTFAKFIKRECLDSVLDDFHFRRIISLFENLEYLNEEMCNILNQKIGVPLDLKTRQDRSKKATEASVSGKDDLKEKYISYFNKYTIEKLGTKKYPHDRFIINSKFNGLTNFCQYAQLDLTDILLQYKNTALENNYNYGKNINPENIHSILNKWKNEDENFRKCLGEICKLRKT